MQEFLYVFLPDNFNAKTAARKNFQMKLLLVQRLITKFNYRKQSFVFQCTGCEALTLQPLAVKKKQPDNPKSLKFSIPTGPFVTTHCQHCGHKHHVSSLITHFIRLNKISSSYLDGWTNLF